MRSTKHLHRGQAQANRAVDLEPSEPRVGRTAHDEHRRLDQAEVSIRDGRLDVVAANPPYVPTGATIRDPEVAAHDPAAALWSGTDGLDAMRVLERTAARLLHPGGLLIAEHADVQGDAAAGVFQLTGRWSNVEDHLDLTGRPRYVTATLTTATERA